MSLILCFKSNFQTRLKHIPSHVIQSFCKLGEQQRGRPEDAMLNYQRFARGGVYSNAIEHAGDLIHRITHHVKYETVYHELFKEKIDRLHRTLTRDDIPQETISFQTEHEQNLKSSISYVFNMINNPISDYDLERASVFREYLPNTNFENIVDFERDYRKKTDELLAVYASEHEKLPAYNLLHHLCVNFCVSLGRKNFELARQNCITLKKISDSPEKFVSAASIFYLDEKTNDVVSYADYLANCNDLSIHPSL